MSAISPAVSRREVPASPARLALRWLRAHLFDSWFNTALTLVIAAALAWVIYEVGYWFLEIANWDVVRANRRLLLVGRLPRGDEWRVWPMVFSFAALIGLSWGAWGQIRRRAVVLMILAAIVILPLLTGGTGRPLTALAIGLGVVCYAAARRIRVIGHLQRPLRIVAGTGWFLSFPAALGLLIVDGGVQTSLWGGLYLNVIVAIAATMGALPLGVLLALGRTSSYRALRLTCTTYIELMRGLPLVLMLLLSWLALRSFLPAVWGIDRIPLVYRVMISFALFTGAFIAEALRGGLNGVPAGQKEAAAALGMRPWQVTLWVSLPQAVRNSVPALAGEFIGLFMASSLVAVVGLTDMLQAAQATTDQPAFFGRQKEVLLFVGAVFWVAAFALSRLSEQLEYALGARR